MDIVIPNPLEQTLAHRFELKCLGFPELRDLEGRTIKLKGRRNLALLVYLAVERRPLYSRDATADLFWPGVSMSEARHSLANAVSQIRKALGPSSIVGTRDELKFKHSLLKLDLDRLDAGELIATEDGPGVDVAGFLAGFDIRGCAEFMIWRDRQQARWLPQIHAALLTQIDHGRRTGDTRTNRVLADRLLAIDILSEEGTRAKMESLAMSGDRIAALRVFEDYQERLEAELQASPSQLLEQMARRLRRRGMERSATDPVPSAPTDSWRDRPFVGRAMEYRHLYDTWEKVMHGNPNHVLVEGESGIGKSTLVERFSVAAALEGAIVVRAQCYELERALPFSTMSGLVTGLLDKPGVSGTSPASLAEVARVVPRVHERFSSLPPPIEIHGETARLHFAEGILAMMAAVMEEHPLIVVVDDFHLADEVSLTVLHLLIRRTEKGRFMVMLTMRDSELSPTSGAARIRDGGEYLQMTRLALPPLSDVEIAELLTALVPPGREPPNPSERQALLQAARGVPMVLQLLFQDWARHGSDSLAIAARSMSGVAESGDRGSMESTYRKILARILVDLDGVTRLVLNAATVLGSRLNDLSLYGLADLTVSQTMMGMAELVRRHILKDSPSGLDFVNELVRNEAYLEMPGALRRALHGAVAENLLARLKSGEEQVHGLEAAWHLVRAGRPADAAPHLLRGAREAIREGAPHEAELALRTALRDDAMLVGTSRHEALLLHAEVLQELSMWSESLTQLAILPEELKQTHRERRAILGLIGEQHLQHYQASNVHDAIKQLISIEQTSCDENVRARAVSVAATFLEELQITEAEASVGAAISRVETSVTDPDDRAFMLMARATFNYYIRNLDSSIQDTRDAIKLMEDIKNFSSTYVNLTNGLSALQCAMGDYASGLQNAHIAYKLARRLDNTYLARKAAGNLAVCSGRLGKYEDQEAWGWICLKHLDRVNHGHVHMRAADLIGSAKAMRYHSDAMAVYMDIIEQSDMTTGDWRHQVALLNQADIYMLMGKKRLALQVGRRATHTEYERLLARGWAGKFARWLAQVAIHDGLVTDATTKLEEFTSTINRFDAIDRVEIICAYLRLCDQLDLKHIRLIESAYQQLVALPSAVSDQLERLGTTKTLDTARASSQP